MEIGAVVLKLGKNLAKVLKNDLEAIPFLLCITTNMANLAIATEKYFGTQANYIQQGIRMYHVDLYNTSSSKRQC